MCSEAIAPERECDIGGVFAWTRQLSSPNKSQKMVFKLNNELDRSYSLRFFSRLIFRTTHFNESSCECRESHILKSQKHRLNSFPHSASCINHLKPQQHTHTHRIRYHTCTAYHLRKCNIPIIDYKRKNYKKRCEWIRMSLLVSINLGENFATDQKQNTHTREMCNEASEMWLPYGEKRTMCGHEWSIKNCQALHRFWRFYIAAFWLSARMICTMHTRKKAPPPPPLINKN